jgi:hypothetical protein
MTALQRRLPTNASLKAAEGITDRITLMQALDIDDPTHPDRDSLDRLRSEL